MSFIKKLPRYDTLTDIKVIDTLHYFFKENVFFKNPYKDISFLAVEAVSKATHDLGVNSTYYFFFKEFDSGAYEGKTHVHGNK